MTLGIEDAAQIVTNALLAMGMSLRRMKLRFNAVYQPDTGQIGYLAANQRPVLQQPTTVSLDLASEHATYRMHVDASPLSVLAIAKTTVDQVSVLYHPQWPTAGLRAVVPYLCGLFPDIPTSEWAYLRLEAFAPEERMPEIVQRVAGARYATIVNNNSMQGGTTFRGGIAGKYGHGKDYVCAAICRSQPTTLCLSFASALKSMCGLMLGGASFDTQADKDTPIAPDARIGVMEGVMFFAGKQPQHLGGGMLYGRVLADIAMEFDAYFMKKRPRTRGELLQVVGTEIVRNRIHENAWIDIVESQIIGANHHGTPWIVTDVRYPNEVAMVRRHGGVVLRVEAPALTPGTRDHAHPSETALDAMPLPTLVNDRSAGQNAAIARLPAGVDALEVRPSRFWRRDQ